METSDENFWWFKWQTITKYVWYEIGHSNMILN